jgi:hypothetical protein
MYVYVFMCQTRKVLFNLLILPLECNIVTIWSCFHFQIPLYQCTHIGIYQYKFDAILYVCQFNIENNKPTYKGEQEVGNMAGMINGEMGINDSSSNTIEGNST